MSDFIHRSIETNGINMHVVEQGQGPLVIMCHGWPESWYSWRHQLSALADAGFRAVAPDQRGYGQTDKPEAIEAYDMFQLTGDIVGHDWGAGVAWHCALLRPDIFHALGLLSVPYMPRPAGTMRATDALRQMAGDQEFYQLYFQEPGKAEAELEANVRESMLAILYSISGTPPPEHRWRFLFGKDERFLDSVVVPDTLPPWLTEEDLDFFTKEFEHSGFRGGLNWYRNIDRMVEGTPFLIGARIQQPTLYVAGELDAVLLTHAEYVQALP